MKSRSRGGGGIWHETRKSVELMKWGGWQNNNKRLSCPQLVSVMPEADHIQQRISAMRNVRNAFAITHSRSTQMR
jgi:hypothetical protein